ncbi:MAG: hypothetical protein Q8O82_06210 [Pseudorhodobacter sp.]|nr:hypothetical protein [Pseudorhodobacter sp.]
MVTADIPCYPRHLAPAERRAALLQSARDIVDATIRECGFDPASVDRDAAVAEAETRLTAAWLTERVAALEAEVASLLKSKDKP